MISAFSKILLPAGLLVTSLANAVAEPLFHSWAERPVMGWNSWDFYGTTVTEAQTKAQADFMAANLKSHGWELITVDIQWCSPIAANDGFFFNYDTPNSGLTMDGNARLQPATNRFPSAAGGQGFTALADYVHGLGLKFGIHIMRGIPKHAVVLDLPILGTTATAADIADTSSICPWNPDMYGVDMSQPGAQEYYDSLFAMYAAWGVDFVKVDDISRPYDAVQQAELEAIREAIDKTGREIVLSLSPGETPLGKGSHVMLNANQWRVSDDFWDNWGALYDQFERLHNWTPYRGPGFFPDADMLPLGKLSASGADPDGRVGNFTQDEQFTLMTLWSTARSPLIHGGDMTQMDAFTLALLTNDEVIAVNQRSMHNRQLYRIGHEIAWVADDEDSADKYLALFNTGDSAREVPVNLANLGFSGTVQIRSLWEQADLGGFGEVFSPSVPAHGAKLYRLAGAVLPTPWITAASADSGGVTVAWEVIPAAASYTVKRATSERGPFLTIASGLTTASYLDTTVGDRQSYFYVVSAMVTGEETPDSGARQVISAGLPQTVSWNYDHWSTVGGDGAGSFPPLDARAGAERTGGWSQSYPNNPTTNLRDASGGTTDFAINYSSSNGGYSMQGSHPGQDADGSWNKEMLNGYLNAGGGGSSSVTITGIPHPSYDLYVYFSSDVANREGSVSDGTTTYYFRSIGPSSISGANAVLTQATDTVDDAQDGLANYAVFSGLTGTQQTVTVTIPSFGGLAGFQVVPPDANAGDGTEITSQPDSLSLLEGETADFTVVATGTGGLTYQWYRASGAGDVALVDGGRVTGTATANLQISGTTPADAGAYYVHVSDDMGGGTPVVIYSDYALLEVSEVSATATLGTTVPPVGDGVQNLSYSTNDATGTQLQFVASDYLGSQQRGDNLQMAQSFTTGSNAGGYLLHAISVRQVAWGPTSWDYDGGSVTLRILELTSGGGPVWNAVELAAEIAVVAGNGNATIGGTPDAPRWLTITLETPVALSSDALYAFAMGASGGAGNGGFFMNLDGTATNSYPDGFALSVPEDSNALWDGDNSRPSDRAFVANMSAVTSGNDYATWIAGYEVGAMTGLDQDPDGDGIPNGVENFFGTNPGQPGAGIVQVARTGEAFTFQHPQNPTPASDLTATYRWSTDLITWHADGESAGGLQIGFSAETAVDGPTTVTATANGPLPPVLFTNIQVTQE